MYFTLFRYTFFSYLRAAPKRVSRACGHPSVASHRRLSHTSFLHDQMSQVATIPLEWRGSKSFGSILLGTTSTERCFPAERKLGLGHEV
jgi:hypothetical protein